MGIPLYILFQVVRNKYANNVNKFNCTCKNLVATQFEISEGSWKRDTLSYIPIITQDVNPANWSLSSPFAIVESLWSQYQVQMTHRGLVSSAKQL